jgi:ABC-type transport system involved in multi-copper enzyme maturation permease subunit
MLGAGRRIAAIAFNTYREAVRARILLGLFGLALATALYSIIVGEYALKNASRVVADLGAASISIYAIIVAVIIGATSLYRELEQKTIFPILARPVKRAEYLVGKYAGTLLTIAVFIALDAAVVLLILARHGGRSWTTIAITASAFLIVPASMAYYLPRWRTYLPIGWAAAALAVAVVLASGATDDRRVVLAASSLALMEVMIVSALATLFSSFSSPFLSAVFTVGLFVMGRQTGTLGRLPVRMFGEIGRRLGAVLATLLPNLDVYVPPRPLLTGEALNVSLGRHLAFSGVQAIAWSVGLIVVSSFIFDKRDLS